MQGRRSFTKRIGGRLCGLQSAHECRFIFVRLRIPTINYPAAELRGMLLRGVETEQRRLAAVD